MDQKKGLPFHVYLLRIEKKERERQGGLFLPPGGFGENFTERAEKGQGIKVSTWHSRSAEQTPLQVIIKTFQTFPVTAQPLPQVGQWLSGHRRWHLLRAQGALPTSQPARRAGAEMEQRAGHGLWEPPLDRGLRAQRF